MTTGSQNRFPKVILVEDTLDSSPTPTGEVHLRVDSATKLLYQVDDAGTVTPFGSGGYTPGGTDVAVADGGTGASSASAARTNLGLVIGTNVAAQSHASQHEAGGSDEIDATGLVGAGGGGGSAAPGDYGDRVPVNPGSYTYLEDFEGTADTLPSGWSWVHSGGATPAGFFLNSTKPSHMGVRRNGTSATTYIARKSLAPTGDFGIWAKLSCTTLPGGYINGSRLYILDSTSAEGRGFGIYTGGSQVQTFAMNTGTSAAWDAISVLSAGGPTAMYFGLTRKSSTNGWRSYWSLDGVDWMVFNNADVVDTFTPARIEWWSLQNDSGVDRSDQSVDWIRVLPSLAFPTWAE